MQTIPTLASPFTLRVFRRGLWRRAGDRAASAFRHSRSVVHLRQRLYLCAVRRADARRHHALDAVATSGVVLFGIALVFTFNALVSMMQFIASEDTP